MARSFYAGTVVLGEALNAPFITDPNNGQATAVTGTPQYWIYSADMSTTLVTAANATAVASLTGSYYIPETIASGTFEAGESYNFRITYVISATTYTKWGRFTVT